MEQFELNLVVGAGAAVGESAATDRRDPNLKLRDLVVFRLHTGKFESVFAFPPNGELLPPMICHPSASLAPCGE